MLTLNDGRSELWQWDTGRTLTVDADCSQVHFSNKVFGRSIDVDVVGGVAIVPDILLQTDKDLTAWAFVGTAENGYTKISKVFKVNKRNKPADYVFTPTDQTTLEEVLDRIEDLENRPSADISKEDIQDAVNEYLDNNHVSVNETDPTVPDWAKRPQKPTYTAKEVGAMPAETTIPAPYVLPIANPETLGGVKPVAKGADMTQKVGVDELGGLWTAPGGAGGSEVWMKIRDATLEENTGAIKVTFASTKMKHIRVQVRTAAAEADTNYGSVIIFTDDYCNESFRNARSYIITPPPRKDARLTFIEAKIILDDGNPSLVIENHSITNQGDVKMPGGVAKHTYNNYIDGYGNALNPYITGFQISTYGTFVAGTNIKIWGVPV